MTGPDEDGGHTWTSTLGPVGACSRCGQVYPLWGGDPCPGLRRPENAPLPMCIGGDTVWALGLDADLAAMTARALAAEDRLALAEVHIEEMRDDRDQARAEVQRLTAALELAEVDLDTIAAIRAHDGTGPETGPSATHSPQQATVEGQDPDGPRDDSGPRVPLPGRYGDDPIGRRLLDMPHEYAQHDEMDIPVCVCGWNWGHAVHGGPERAA